MTEMAELLTTDDDGNAVQGPKYPIALNVALYRDPPPPDDVGMYSDNDGGDDEPRPAYVVKFFRRDKRGCPMPETLVSFFVPEHLLLSPGRPTTRALRLVAQRMGWDAKLPETRSQENSG